MIIPAIKKYHIIQQMIEREGNMLNVTWLYDAAGVSRSGYYNRGLYERTSGMEFKPVIRNRFCIRNC